MTAKSHTAQDPRAASALHAAIFSQWRIWSLVLLLGLSLSLSGCNYFVLIGYLIGGPPSIEPEFDSLTKESMTDKDITVAVVCFAPTDVRFSFENIDHELAKFVSFRMHSKKIKVINPDRVKAWLDQNKDWDKPDEIGAAFRCNYVIYIDLKSFGLYEEGSANLYRGRAEAIVNVVKMDKENFEDGEKIFSKEVISKYPIHQPKSTADESYANFKSMYLARLSEEIGRMFYEYYSADDVGDGA